MSSIIGLYIKLTPRPNQKLLHSGHSSGTRKYGILATRFRTGKNISAKLYIYDTDTDKIKKYNKSNNIIRKIVCICHPRLQLTFDETPTFPIAFCL
jgi:hypothetical protein